VEEYKQKMVLYMMRVGIEEDESITVARFLSGLSLEIRDRDLNDLDQLSI